MASGRHDARSLETKCGHGNSGWPGRARWPSVLGCRESGPVMKKVEKKKKQLVELAAGRLEKDETVFPYKFTKNVPRKDCVDAEKLTNFMKWESSSAENIRKFKLMDKLVRELNAMLDREEFEDVVSKATDAISNIVKETSKCSAIDNNLLYLYHIRARSLSRLGKEKETIEDATAALELIPVFMECQSAVDENGLSSEGLDTHLQDMQSKFLNLRGMSSFNLGDLNGALIDFRASLLILRSLNMEREAAPILDIITRSMVLLKLGCPRPHYTDAERRAWRKELCLKEYARDRHRCLGCSAPPSTGLKLCGGCSAVWFCGRECQAAAWPEHRAVCKRPARNMTVVPTRDEAVLRANIAADGFSAGSAPGSGEPAMFVLDPATGRVFESLSDQVRARAGRRSGQGASSRAAWAAARRQDVVFAENPYDAASVAAAVAALQVALPAAGREVRRELGAHLHFGLLLATGLEPGRA